jgi:ATP-dependent RNA helicase DeaD
VYFDKIINTPINNDIKPFLTSLTENLNDLSKDDLIAKITSQEFQKKLTFLKHDDGNKLDRKKDKDLRYQINLGIKDHYNWQNLKDFLIEICSLNPGDIYNVDVQQSKSFFNSKPEHKDLIFNVFNNFKIDKRTIRVNITSRRGQKDESSSFKKERKYKREKRKKTKRSKRNY